MSTTISNGTTTISPELVLGYQADQDSRNVIHTVLGRSDPEITLQAVGLRKGTLNYLFTSASAAENARTFHSEPGVFVLTSTEAPITNMAYVLDGSVAIELEDETRELWTLSIDFQEVIQ